MLALQYLHRLPADYDLQHIRERVRQRAPEWVDTEGLVFKAFVTRTRGQLGALASAYGAVYLWADERQALRFLTGDRFQAVTTGFGRPAVETWLPLDARRGSGGPARALYREDVVLSPDEDLAALQASERERHARVIRDADTVASWSALDVARWQLVRFSLSADAPQLGRASQVFEVAHLAAPGLAALP